jgi:hypothetical protein
MRTDGALCVGENEGTEKRVGTWLYGPVRHLSEFLIKTRLIAHEITGGHFYRRPGKRCSWCDYLPVCAGDEAAAPDTLIEIR